MNWICFWTFAVIWMFYLTVYFFIKWSTKWTTTVKLIKPYNIPNYVKKCLFLCLKAPQKAYYFCKQNLTISPDFLPWSPYFWFLKVGSPGYTRKPDALHRCSQDRKSRYPETETLYLQDRDETETLNPQDRDETETLNPQDRDETETFDFSKLSRPRWDRDVQPSRPRRDREVPKNVSRPSRDRDVQDRDYIPAC